MPRSLITPKRVLLTLAALLLVNSVLPLWFAATVGKRVGGAVKATLSPVTANLVAVATTIRPPAEDRSDLGPEAERDKELRLARVLIRKYEAELDAKEKQLQRLMRSAEVLRLEGTELVDVRVTGYSGDPRNPVLTINRGTARGVDKRLAVIYEANFVGVVDSDRALTADVRLITAPGSSLLVKIQPPGIEAAVRSAEYFLTLAPDGESFEVDVPSGTAIAAGDIASLSDSQGHWPREATGCVVGLVRSVMPDRDDPLNFDTVTVTPAIELPRLSSVTVLKPVEQ